MNTQAVLTRLIDATPGTRALMNDKLIYEVFGQRIPALPEVSDQAEADWLADEINTADQSQADELLALVNPGPGQPAPYEFLGGAKGVRK